MSNKIGYVIPEITENKVTEAKNVMGSRNLVLEIVGSGTAGGTIKLVGSISPDMPNFGATAGKGNAYEFIQMIDLQDGSAIDGDDGITFTGDDVRLLEVNANSLQYIGFIASVTGGEFNIRVQGK